MFCMQSSYSLKYDVIFLCCAVGEGKEIHAILHIIIIKHKHNENIMLIRCFFLCFFDFFPPVNNLVTS
jgi:hypothetical protein